MNQSVIKSLLQALVIIGVIVPYAAFIPFVIAHGLDIPLAIQQAIQNKISIFAWLDVIVSAVVLLIVVFYGKLISPRQATLVLLLTCCAGVSAGLPLLFYFYYSHERLSTAQ